MDDWQQMLKNSLTDPEVIAKRFNLNSKDLERIAQEFKIRVTPYYASLIKEKGQAIGIANYSQGNIQILVQ